MKNLLHSSDLNRQEILALFEKAGRYLPLVEGHQKTNDAEGYIMATLFYEPSTRTRFSFESAMCRLGGNVISNSHMEFTSSAKKGETIYDTGKVVSQMADILVMRHPEKDSIDDFARGSDVPVINAGNGPGDHPTQGLLDLFTIQSELGRLDNLCIAMVGDLKYGRVVHSQCEYLSQFEGIRFLFISPEELKMPSEIVESLRAKGFEVVETEDLEGNIGEADVVSHTRIQKERFPSEADYNKHKGVYVFTPELMKMAKEDMILIHPLPRVDEIDPVIDEDPRVRYFKQIQYGVAVRMAIVSSLLDL